MNRCSIQNYILTFIIFNNELLVISVNEMSSFTLKTKSTLKVNVTRNANVSYQDNPECQATKINADITNNIKWNFVTSIFNYISNLHLIQF